MEDCIEWTGAHTVEGYGQTRFEGRRVYAHRLAFFKAHGWWPQVVRHSCDNPPCWNQVHLNAGTHADNVRDMVARGRNAHGANHGGAKLSWNDICAMRDLHILGESVTALATRYAVAYSTAWAIVNRKTRVLA